jgi:hypothetical protein
MWTSATARSRHRYSVECSAFYISRDKQIALWQSLMLVGQAPIDRSSMCDSDHAALQRIAIGLQPRAPGFRDMDPADRLRRSEPAWGRLHAKREP